MPKGMMWGTSERMETRYDAAEDALDTLLWAAFQDEGGTAQRKRQDQKVGVSWANTREFLRKMGSSNPSVLYPNEPNTEAKPCGTTI
jgi:hypothetical protein